MAYNIVLSPNQSFTAGDPLPNIDWQFDQPNPLAINHFAGTAQPANIGIATVIKNYLASGVQVAEKSMDEIVDNVFEDIYVKIEIEHPILNSQTKEWLNVSGEIAAAAAPGYKILSDNLEVTTTLEFKSFNSMLQGSTETKIHFVVLGELATSQLIEIDRYTFTVRLNVLSQNQTKASREQINFFQLLDEALAPSTTFDITAFGGFSIQVPEYITLSGSSLSLTSTTDGYRLYDGSGSQTITVALNADALELAANTYADLLVIESSAGIVETMSLNTFVAQETPPLFVTPSSLSWTLIQQFPYASQNVLVTGLGNTTLTVTAVPSWLQVSIVQLSNVATVTVMPINTAFLSPGSYTASLVFTSGAQTKNVQINLTVINRINLGLSLTGINFTDDFNTISTFHYSSAFNIALKLDALVSSFFPYAITQKTLDYLFGIHNFYADFFIGKVIKNTMVKLRDLNQITLPFLPSAEESGTVDTPTNQPYKYMYQPASVNVQVEFINRSSGNILFTESFSEIKFIKGRKPSRFSKFGNTQIAVLDFYNQPTRVTKNSVKVFNFYANTAVRLFTFVNGILHDVFNFTPQNHRIFHYRINFASFNQGDVIELRLSRVGITSGSQATLTQKYIMFPEGKDSFHIGWINEHELLETFEFTGDLTFKAELENRTVLTYQKFLEKIEKVEVKDGQKLNCNTGFVLKDDARRLRALLKSKQAFLMSRDAAIKPINLIPINKEIENMASDRELYEYEIEFDINLPNDSEIYPR